MRIFSINLKKNLKFEATEDYVVYTLPVGGLNQD